MVPKISVGLEVLVANEGVIVVLNLGVRLLARLALARDPRCAVRSARFREGFAFRGNVLTQA
jgi:hypothetical protein